MYGPGAGGLTTGAGETPVVANIKKPSIVSLNLSSASGENLVPPFQPSTSTTSRHPASRRRVHTHAFIPALRIWLFAVLPPPPCLFADSAEAWQPVTAPPTPHQPCARRTISKPSPMSEVASRPTASRGRGSGRGGRGGFAGRGGRRANGDKSDHKAADDGLGAFDDEGDFAELRKQYGDKTSVIREMFPDWSEVDVLFALQETNGDQNEAVARIAEGTISQWGEVSKSKKTTRAKVKDTTTSAPATAEAPTAGARPARGGRVASEGGRGRGRGSERGGRGGRGRATHASTNGARNKENQQLSVPTEESPAWDNETMPVRTPKPEPKTTAADKPTTASDLPKPAAPQAKTWASMLRQSTAPKLAPAPKEPPAPETAAEPLEPQPMAEPVEPEPDVAEPEGEITPVAQRAIPVQPPAVAEPETDLPPTKDELTETNLEQVVDDSNPPPTDTAASTAADSWDPRQSPVSATATPLSASQRQHQALRTAACGYAASAMKATAERSTRVPSYQRRVLDQEEAVRMPGNREVDRAAVQFGAFSLNGGDEDVDGEREEPETRAQPPADSPVAHPRASLPPVSQPVAVPEAFSHKPAAAVPSGAAGVATQTPVPNAQQYGRFGHGISQEAAAASVKPADPFNQQTTPVSQPPFDNFAAQATQPQAQLPAGALSSAPSDYSNYYTANQQERNPYNFYGQQYSGQQGAHGQHEGVPSQQRPFGGYNAQSDNLSQYPQSGTIHNQPRFGGSSDSHNSGHSTPNPAAQTQQQQQGQQTQQAAQQQAQQQAQQPQQQGAPGTQPQSHGQQQYPNYNHPYYSNPYYHQYYSGYGQGGFAPYGKGGMYGQPYGVSPNAPYDHSSSPGTFGPSSLHRNSGLGSGLGDAYGRAGSGQAGSQPGLGGSSFGGAHESFARGASSFQSQGQSFNSQTQPPVSGSTDDLKPFGDGKAASGPSPSLGGGPRPGSATNNAPSGQSGLPPPQTSQMGGGYGGYPSHLQGHGLHGSGAYGMGAGAGGASQHGSTPYGSYGQGFGSGGYYGDGQQQQRGGWGGNYH
ncbi:Uncharacterized protein TCAP_00938 [Tolypocladium capitatum]|uniref:RNA polymerase II degradation factor 1 n=1 Tax=Tolypocladium capitatum TaxID=45235 RepID=A0A2K3QNM8_9HYPO|nr:Uncharacterized protein TCAP_00938 [Tolypocladium capitatum]